MIKIHDIADGVRAGNVRALAKAITLIESRNLDHSLAATTLLDELLPDSPHRPHARLKTFVDDRPGHDWRYAIDAGKLSAALGYTPQETFETGLERTLDWFLANEEWWRPLLTG